MNETRIRPVGVADISPASDGSLNISIPIKITRRGRCKSVMLPDGTAFRPLESKSAPTPIQLALARGHQWLEMLNSGQADGLAELADKLKVDRAYVGRMVNLTTLAPDIVAAILDETLPSSVTLFDLASATPLLWEEQRAMFNMQELPSANAAAATA